MADSCYRSASRARQQMVRLAPQYRRNDKYNAEGEFLETIRFQMQLRRLFLRCADKLESESLNVKTVATCATGGTNGGNDA
jgi:hypothetical protein